MDKIVSLIVDVDFASPLWNTTHLFSAFIKIMRGHEWVLMMAKIEYSGRGVKHVCRTV